MDHVDRALVYCVDPRYSQPQYFTQLPVGYGWRFVGGAQAIVENEATADFFLSELARLFKLTPLGTIAFVQHLSCKAVGDDGHDQTTHREILVRAAEIIHQEYDDTMLVELWLHDMKNNRLIKVPVPDFSKKETESGATDSATVAESETVEAPKQLVSA